MKRPLDLLYNFHWIVPGEAARSAQSHFGFLGAFLDGNGIRAIVNLRGRNPDWRWWRYETRICREKGIAHFDTGLDSRRLPRPEILIALVDAFDKAPRPLLVKCSGGQDRASFAAALYILHRDGWDGFARAAAQFSRFPHLHFPRANQRWLRLFLDYAKLEANGAPISSWLRTGYDRAQLQAWLEANGHADSFAGLLTWQD